MADIEKWKKRVEEWRASGQSAGEYCKGQPFTVGTLYRWSSRLGQAAESQAVDAMPLMRVVRGAEPSVPAPLQVAPASAAVILEVGGTRVLVPPGADVATVGVVLEALRAGARSQGR